MVRTGLLPAIRELNRRTREPFKSPRAEALTKEALKLLRTARQAEQIAQEQLEKLMK